MSDGAGGIDGGISGRTDAVPPAGRRGWWARNVVLVVGVALVVLGAIVAATTPGLGLVAVPTFGWDVYAESTAPLTSAPPFWEEQVVQGVALAVLGLVVLAASLGYRAGRRRAARSR